MEDTVRHTAPSHHSSHQLIQTRCGAGKHVVEIAHGDYHALGFTRSSRCVKNGGGVLWRERYGRYDRGEVHVGPTGVHVRAEGPAGVREVRVDERGVHTSDQPADSPPPPPTSMPPA